MKTISAALLTSLIFALTAASALAQEGVGANAATDAALVLVEIGADDRAAAQREAVSVEYRQVRAYRERVSPRWTWQSETIEVGYRGRAEDYSVNIGRFPNRASAALVVPRHDPELTKQAERVKAFYRDCLVFSVGGKPIASLFVSAPPRSPHPHLFWARFGPEALDLDVRQDSRQSQGLETWTDATCPSGIPLPTNGRLEVAGLTFTVQVVDLEHEVFDTRPEAMSGFTVFEVLGEQPERVRVLLEKVCGPKLSTLHFVCSTSALHPLDEKPTALALLDGDELVGVVTDAGPAGIGVLPASGGLRSAPVSGDLSRLFGPSNIKVSVLADGNPAKLEIRRVGGEPTIAVPAGYRAAALSLEAVERMRPFGPVLQDRADGGFLLTKLPGTPRLSLNGAGIEQDLVRRVAGDYLLEWAAGERESIPLALPFASAHDVVPRLDRAGDAISLDLSGVPWHVVSMKVRRQGAGATAAKDWVLESGSRRVRFVEGDAPSFEVAGLLGQAQRAQLSVHPAGERFAGYRSADVTISMEDLRSMPILTLQVEAEPIVLTLTPEILAGATPALRLRQVDGSTIDIVGEVDRFGAEGGKVVGPDRRGLSRLSIEAPAIASIEPIGLGGMGPRIATASALHTFIKATSDDYPRSRCEALNKSMGLPRDDVIVAHVASSDTVVVARRRVADGIFEITTMPESALSSRYRVLSGWPAADTALWHDGAWLPAAQAACQEIYARRSSTAYLMVVVDRFEIGSSRPASPSAPSPTNGSETNPFDNVIGELEDDTQFNSQSFLDAGAVAERSSVGATLQDLNKEWSPAADEVRRRLTKAGIRTVVGIVAYIDGGYRAYEVSGRVENLQRSVVPFRELFRRLFDGSIASAPGELDEPPRSLRVGLEAAMAGELVPLSRLIVLDRPRTDGSGAVVVTGFDEPAVLEMRAVDGFLNEGATLADAFDAALREPE